MERRSRKAGRIFTVTAAAGTESIAPRARQAASPPVEPAVQDEIGRESRDTDQPLGQGGDADGCLFRYAEEQLPPGDQGPVASPGNALVEGRHHPQPKDAGV